MGENKCFKVLSIDFDYFQTVDCDTLRECYPDGIDLPTHLSTVVWASYYANPNTEKRIYDVGINEDEFAIMQDILCEQHPATPVLIAQSHKHIYDFIVQQMENNGKTEKDELYITNIDMHHDMKNNNSELDCGNWVKHIQDRYNRAGLEWITPPVSLEMYGFKKEEWTGVISTSLSEIRQTEFDAIFLCRSDNWLPPHLDVFFSELCNVLKYNFTNVTYQKGIFDMREYEEIAAKEREFFKRQKHVMDKQRGERVG